MASKTAAKTKKEDKKENPSKTTKGKTSKKAKAKETNVETFEYEGELYTANPSTEVFFADMARAKLISSNMATKAKKAFIEKKWVHLSNFEKKTYDEIANVKNVGKETATIIFHHKRMVAAKGKILKTINDQVEDNKKRQYLLTQVEDLNFNLFDGNELGFRSGTLIEFYGKPQMGKTQWMYDLTIRCLLPPEKGGWGRSVIYIDTEGAFSAMRLLSAARYWGLNEKDIEGKFFLIEPVTVTSGNDLFAVIDTIDQEVIKHDVGLVIVDSIIQPFRAEFASVTGSDLKRMAPRQSLLGKTLAKLKSLATSHQLIAAYTNHVMANIGGAGMGPSVVPLGGDTVGHASDLRFYLRKKKAVAGMEVRNMQLKDCGWLHSFDVDFLLSEVGILPNDTGYISNVKKLLKDLEKKGADELTNHLGEPIAKSAFTLNVNEYLLKRGLSQNKTSKIENEEDLAASAD